MNLKKIKTILFVIFAVLFCNIEIFAQEQMKFNTYQRNNEQGYSTSASGFLDGNEIVTEYDGNFNLTFSMPFGLENFGGNFSVTLNNNVNHVSYSLNFGYTKKEKYNFNSPEWIFGFMGFAVQTLNFEVNAAMGHANANGVITLSSQLLMGKEVPMLIPGYHFCTDKALNQITGRVSDKIEILRADGSTLVLYNKVAEAYTGIYYEHGKTNTGYAIVKFKNSGNNLRKIYYKPGDGNTYYFEEEMGNYITSLGLKQLYLLSVINNQGDTIKLEYDYSGCVFEGFFYAQYLNPDLIGRKQLTKITLNKVILQHTPVVWEGHKESFEIDYFCNPVPGGYELGYLKVKNPEKNYNYILKVKNNSSSKLYNRNRNSGNNDGSINNYSITRIENEDRVGCNLNYNFIKRSFTENGYINIDQPLYVLSKITYDNNKTTQLYYSNPGGDLYEMTPASTVGISPNALNIIKYSYRDNFTNLMLNERKQISVYNGISDVVTDNYSYIWNEGTNTLSEQILNENNVYGIKTVITHSNNNGKQLKNIKTFDIQRAIEYPHYFSHQQQENENKVAKTLLVKDEYFENSILKKILLSTYDTTKASDNDAPTYLKIKECEKVLNNSDILVQKDCLNYEYTYIPVNNAFPENGDNKLLIKSVKSTNGIGISNQTYYNSDFIVTENNQFNSENAFFRTNLTDSEKVFNGNLVKTIKTYKYFNQYNCSDHQLFGLLKEEITNPGNRQLKNIYTYFPSDDQFKWNLNRIISENGVNQEFSFNHTYYDIVAMKFKWESIITNAKRHRVNGTDSVVYFSQGNSMKPSKFKLSYNSTDSLTFYLSFNNNFALESKVDENLYFSEYYYDLKGRIKNVWLPGGFPVYGQDFYNVVKSVTFHDTIYSQNFYTIDCDGTLRNGDFNIITKGCDDPVINNNLSSDQQENQFGGDIFPDEVIPEVPPGLKKDAFFYLERPITKSTHAAVINANLLIPVLYTAASNPQEKRVIVIEPILSPYESGKTSYNLGAFQVIVNASPGVYSNADLSAMLSNMVNSGKTVYGFRLKSTNLTSGTFKQFNLSSVYYDRPLLCLTGYKKQTFPIPIASKNFVYDEINNRVLDNTLLNYVGNTPVIVKKTIGGDPMGLQRIIMINDSSNIKVKSNYEYLFKKAILTDNAVGMVDTTTYDYIGRPIKISHKDTTSSTIEYITASGNILAGNGSTSVNYFEFVKTTDEANKIFFTYFDNFGRKVAEKRGDSCTVFLYDGLSRLTKVISARGLVTTYEYDDLGFLKSKITPDEGKINYKSDKYGNLRFVYYSKESQSGPFKVYFSNYDQLHRLKTKGIFQIDDTSGWSYLNPDVLHANEGIQNNWLVVNCYDKKDLATYPFNGVPSYTQNNLKSRLTQTAFRDKPGTDAQSPWGTKLYSYNHTGKVSFYWVKQPGGNFMKIENYYDIAGNLTCQILPDEEQRFYYTYDSQGRLDSVKNGKAGQWNISAVYSYTPDDKIREIKLYNEDREHSYSLLNNYNQKRGWVNSITGKPVNSQVNTFIENLTYLQNGLVSNQQILNSAMSPTPVSHGFTYDSKNQLTGFTYSADPTKNQNFSYDADGNITWVNSIRYDYSNSSGKTNKLITVNYPGESEKIFYSYDYKGNLNSKFDQKNTPHQNYIVSDKNYQNLPLKITSTKTSEYMYDDMANRIFKKTYTTSNPTDMNNEYYLRDHTGRELAVYESSMNSTPTQLKMINLWGSDLFGRIDFTSSYQDSYDECSEDGDAPLALRTQTKVYYVKDHLGSIRQTIESNGTTILSAQDYYPFGKILRSSTNPLANDKYKFTGKERDNETNFDYFGARFYDSEIGRWLSIDPLADKYPGWSPYNYCFNNPLVLIDPDGKAPQDDKYNTTRYKVNQQNYTRREIIFAFLFTEEAFQVKKNVEPAINKTAELYGYTTDGSKANAFQHAYFTALNVYDIGEGLARCVGENHEEYEENRPLDKEMDLFNNELGITIVKEMKEKGIDKSQLASKIKEAIDNGRGKMIDRNTKKLVSTANKDKEKKNDKK